jgi:hypothetical protein
MDHRVSLAADVAAEATVQLLDWDGLSLVLPQALTSGITPRSIVPRAIAIEKHNVLL